MMLRPLLDRILVEVDDSIPTQAGFIIPIHIDKWTGKDGAVESYGRGRVVSCGPGKRHPKSLQCQRMEFQAGSETRPVREGDVVRFSELVYPEHKEDGKRFALITEADIVGVEA